MFIGFQELILFSIVGLCLYFTVLLVQFYGIGLMNIDIYLMFYTFMTFNMFLFRKTEVYEIS
jgi:hypothetical protein